MSFNDLDNKYKFLYSQAVMKSDSYDSNGKDCAGAVPNAYFTVKTSLYVPAPGMHEA